MMHGFSSQLGIPVGAYEPPGRSVSNNARFFVELYSNLQLRHLTAGNLVEQVT